jgi:hypothetical protein
VIVEHVLDTLPTYHKSREELIRALRCWTTAQHPARTRIEESSRGMPLATKVHEGRSKLVELQIQCATLFYLWRSDLERQHCAKECELKPEESIVDGVAKFGELIGRKMEEVNDWFGELEVQLREQSQKGGAR